MAELWFVPSTLIAEVVGSNPATDNYSSGTHLFMAALVILAIPLLRCNTVAGRGGEMSDV